MSTISQIEVKGLFGKYDYQINSKNRNVFLYGDNGSGKSTILRLVFHLLCTQEGSGHKTWVANCPFRSIDILLSTGSKISAKKKQGIFGSFEMTFQGKTAHSFFFESSYDGNEHSIPRSIPERGYRQFMSIIDKSSPTIFYLTDSRDQLVNEPPYWRQREIFDIEDDQRLHFFKEASVEIFEEGGIQRSRRESRDLSAEVLFSLRRVNTYFNRIVSLASVESDSNVNQIYVKILNDICDPKKPEKSQVDVNKAFGRLSARMADYVRFGLIPNLEVDKFFEIIKKARGPSKTVASRVIIPLLDSLEKRMSALENAMGIIKSFDATINNILLDKNLEYKFGQGIKVKSDSQMIQTSKLSSGEKQIIIILCNLVCKAHNGQIFFIDEPEISLNVKWQRNFVAMLEATTRHGACQFYLATHSMEILAQNTESVINLNDQRNA